MDEQGRQLGANQVRLAEHKAALWQGLFDTRGFVRTYANSVRFTDRPATAAELLAQIGVFLGETVVGPEILAAQHPGVHHRSLLVRQPAALEDRLAAAFARVPWEIASPAAGQSALFERNLVVRVETPGASPAWAPPAPGPDEPLRVLLVFAEAPGSRPLAMRLEREQLLGLFYDEVMPKRRVAMDVLCHGVTRKALREKVRDASGDHVVHWSGHGDHNLLELLGADGKPDRLTGAALASTRSTSWSANEPPPGWRLIPTRRAGGRRNRSAPRTVLAAAETPHGASLHWGGARRGMGKFVTRFGIVVRSARLR